MPIQNVQKRDLLATIAFVQFPDQAAPHHIENKDLFFRKLTDFRRDIIASEEATITEATIRGWVLSEPPSTPKRAPAFHFLEKYWMWIKSITPSRDEERQKYSEALDTFFRVFGGEEAKEGYLAGRGHGEKKTDFIKRDPDLSAKLEAIVGTYQIIRPYVNKANNFVLEPLAIQIDPKSNEAIMLMYSHNQPMKMFMYSGGLSVSSRYGFAFLRRAHENDAETVSLRSVALYLANNKGSSGYQQRDCLSGILLRGVHGDAGVQGPVAIPFVAIKAKNDDANLLEPSFEYLHNSLHKMAGGSHILVGDVNSKRGVIYDFCDHLFANLRHKTMRKGMIYTVTPKEVEDAIAPEAQDGVAYFAAWKEAVEAYFNQYYERAGTKSQKKT